MYTIVDLQIPGRLFADGAIYETKQDVIDQLVSYHNIDFCGSDDKNNELSIEEYFKFWKINTVETQLKYILEHGEWQIEELKSECCQEVLICNGFDIVGYEKNYHLECPKCHRMTELLD